MPLSEPSLDIEFARPFWEATAEHRLVLPRCSDCRRWLWYPDPVGPDCPGAHLEWEQVAGTGTVFTHTVVRRAFLPDQRERVPYTIVFVELDGVDGVRFVANLAEGVEPHIGMRVRVTFEPVGDHVQPVFVPDQG
jgi:hypothetical protein